MNGIKSCPFCGDVLPRYVISRDYSWKGIGYEEVYAMECASCGCRTRYFEKRSLALNAWNRRTNDEI